MPALLTDPDSMPAAVIDPQEKPTVGNRLLEEARRTIQSMVLRHNSLNSGHRACQGCGEALGARYAVDAAYHHTQGQLIVCNATGCLEVFSTPFPQSSWNVPWLHSLFGNVPAVAAGVAAALRAKGRSNIRVVAQGGDGSTVDIGFGCLSGLFERNDDVLYICYDNEAYMNTGVQRSGSTPPRAQTATTQSVGASPGNVFGVGKNVPRIAMAHGIPYVATASIAFLKDLEAKVARAMGMRGARYLHVHVPCPLGWGSEPAQTVHVARLAVACGLFPLFEAEQGEVTGWHQLEDPAPVTPYLQAQKRFANLFGPKPDQAALDAIQAIADRNIARYHLRSASPIAAAPAETGYLETIGKAVAQASGRGSSQAHHRRDACATESHEDSQIVAKAPARK